MKKILMLALVICSLTACENNKEELPKSQTSFDENINLFLKSVKIIPQGRITNIDGTYSKIFKLKMYDSNYEALESYALNGEEFMDNGLNNDRKANDGIYTSVVTQDSNVVFDKKQEISFKSEQFSFADQTNLKTNGGEFGCSIRHVRKGKTLLGFSCAANIGCFELYDCSFKFTW